MREQKDRYEIFLKVCETGSFSKAAQALNYTQSGISQMMAGLEEEDLVFIKKFVLSSGSLKEVAGQYGVTYPTVRLRLDRLIQKIKLGEDRAADPYIALIKRLAVNERLDFDTAKLLIAAYKKETRKDEMT